jgi:hypothetical protein
MEKVQIGGQPTADQEEGETWSVEGHVSVIIEGILPSILEQVSNHGNTNAPLE